MTKSDNLDRLYPLLRTGKKCSNPDCNNMAVHVHHIIPRANILLRYDVQNLIPLCAKCHSEIHDHGAYNRGFDFIDKDRVEYLQKMKNVVFKDYLLLRNITQEDFFDIKEKEIIQHIGKTDFKQNTEEWLEQKNYGVGASEIAAVVKSFLTEDELKKILGEKTAVSFLTEPLYITGYAVYHKIARGYRVPPLEDELNLYGHAMEKYFDWLMKDDEDFIFEGTEDFIKRPDISKYAVCSPDGYATSKHKTFKDVNGRVVETDSLVWEKKTVNPFKAAKEEMLVRGLPWQYIFQNQYQMLLCNKEAGIISGLKLSDDTPFVRGRCTAYIEDEKFDRIKSLYQPEVIHFVYKKLPEIQEAILLALSKFEKAIEEDTPPEINLEVSRLAMSDFKIYQSIYKSNPEARKMATSQDVFSYRGKDFPLDEYLDDFLDLNNIIKDNKNNDDCMKIALKKYLYDNKLVELYSGRGGSIRLSAAGTFLIRSNKE